MIRPFTPDDRDVVLSIWRESNAFAHPFLTDDQVDIVAAMIRDTLLDMADVWIAEADGQPVGFVALLGNEIGGLFLRPAYHRRGIGRALVDHAATLKGALDLAVFAENPTGRLFYKAYGFIEGTQTDDGLFGHSEIRMHLRPDNTG